MERGCPCHDQKASTFDAYIVQAEIHLIHSIAPHTNKHSCPRKPQFRQTYCISENGPIFSSTRTSRHKARWSENSISSRPDKHYPAIAGNQGNIPVHKSPGKGNVRKPLASNPQRPEGFSFPVPIGMSFEDISEMGSSLQKRGLRSIRAGNSGPSSGVCPIGLDATPTSHASSSAMRGRKVFDCVMILNQSLDLSRCQLWLKCFVSTNQVLVESSYIRLQRPHSV